MKTKFFKYSILVLGVSSLGFLGGVFAQYLFSEPKVQNNFYQSSAAIPTSQTSYFIGQQVCEDFSNASQIGMPSVVFIQSVTTQNTYSNNMFDWFFGNGYGSNQVASSGSGVIYSSDGYIITNNHVISNADKIEVVIEKKNYPAEIIGKDPNTDLAVLKINTKNLTAAKLGTSKTLKVGEWVLAIGNPFNLYSTATAGIVSAKARNLNIVNSQFPIESFIQTDAAINPGNSGGALVNIKGELIGINTAIISKTGSYAGYGFAVPIDIVKKVVNDLIAYGEVQKAFGGFEVSDINNQIAERFKLSDLNGVLINYIQKEGEAEKAGLQKDDIIIKINDQWINSKSEFDEQMSYFNPGDKIKLMYRSQGINKEAYLTLTNSEGTKDIIKKQLVSSGSLASDLENVPKVEKDRRNLKSGVRIVRIKGGIFAQLGFREGYIITAINRYPVNSPEEVIEILERIKGRVAIEFINLQNSKSQIIFNIN